MRKEIVRCDTCPAPWPEFASAVRAGPWVFVSAQMATDYERGLPSAIAGVPGLPLHGEDIYIREAEWIIDRLQDILAASGSSLERIARIDQFPLNRSVMNPYITVRNARVRPRPMSTSVGVTSLPFTHCSIAAQAIAFTAESSLEKVGVTTDRVPSPEGGYEPALRVGDFVFVYGQLASDLRNGIAPEASVNPALWYANVVDRQTRYVLQNLKKILEAAGSSLGNVVKANVYLANLDDLPRMDRVWREYFPDQAPARTIMQGTVFGLVGAAIEVNVVALAERGVTKKVVVEVDDPIARFHESAVVKAGELLFMSGLVAAGSEGVVKSTIVAPNHLGLGPRKQTEYILDVAEDLLRQADSSADDIVKADVFLTNMSDMLAVAAVIRSRWPNPPALTFLEVPALYIPGCSVLIDVWAYGRS